jgi:GTPase SAR1 family protein
MINRPNTVLNEDNRRKIFGTYAGEEEDIDRLKQYYLKNEVYESIVADQPLKILVGNKGVGKSALFKYAIAEAEEKGVMPIILRPDVVAEIWEKYENVISTIKKWKFQLIDIIVKKILQELEVVDTSITASIIPAGFRVFRILENSLLQFKNDPDVSDDKKQRIEHFSKSKKIVIYLDDLDRSWQNRQEGITIISALINAIRDLTSENKGLTFKLALRLDVYNAVRTSDESSDKYEGSVVHLSYKIHEIFILLIKRILTFYGEKFDDTKLSKSQQAHLATNLTSLFEKNFRGKGLWANASMKTVLLSLIRNRPRDLIKLCVMAAKEAYNHGANIIMTEHIEAILPHYSKSIIDDTIAEYKSELPTLEKLIYGMRPTKNQKKAEDNFRYTTTELHAKLAQLLINNRFHFAKGIDGDVNSLKDFLYKINFITARKTLEDGTIVRSSYEENSNLSLSYISEGYEWEVHLAYRWVLQPDSLDDIFNKIKLQ